MVPYDPVTIGRRSGSGVCACNFSLQVVEESLEQSISEVHIANWIDFSINENRSRGLTVVGAPMMLDYFHVPLVCDNNNLFGFCFVNELKELSVSLVNKDFFHLWEEDIS